jgi:hypothetical protein
VVAAEVVGNVDAPGRGTCVRFVDDADSPVRIWLRAYIHDRMLTFGA